MEEHFLYLNKNQKTLNLLSKLEILWLNKRDRIVRVVKDKYYNTRVCFDSFETK